MIYKGKRPKSPWMLRGACQQGDGNFRAKVLGRKETSDESDVNAISLGLPFQKQSPILVRRSLSLQYCCVMFRNHFTSLSSSTKTGLSRSNGQGRCEK